MYVYIPNATLPTRPTCQEEKPDDTEDNMLKARIESGTHEQASQRKLRNEETGITKNTMEIRKLQHSTHLLLQVNL